MFRWFQPLFRSLLRSSASIYPVLPNIRVVKSATCHFNKAQVVSFFQSKRFFSTKADQDLELFQTAISGCIERQDLYASFEFYQKLPRTLRKNLPLEVYRLFMQLVDGQKTRLRLLILFFAKKLDATGVIHAYDYGVQNGLSLEDDEVLSVVSRACRVFGDYTLATHYLLRMQKTDISQVRLLLAALGRRGFAHQAELLLNRLRLRYITSPSQLDDESLSSSKRSQPKLDHHCYFAVLWGMSRLGDLEGVDRLLRAMHADGIEMNLRLWNAVVRAYAAAGHPKEAEKIIQLDMKPRFLPNSHTYREILRVYSAQGKLDEVQRVLDNLTTDEIEIDDVLATGLLREYEKRGEGMVINHFVMRTNIPLTINLCNLRLLAYARQSDVQEAIKCVEEMVQADITPDAGTEHALVFLFSKRADPEAARKVFNAFRAYGIQRSIYAYAPLMSAYVAAGQVEEAAKVLEEMRTSGVKVTACAWNILLAEYARLKVVEKVLVIYKQMMNAEKNKEDEEEQRQWKTTERPNYATLSILIRFLGQSGMMSEAKQLYNDTHRYVSNLSQRSNNARNFSLPVPVFSLQNRSINVSLSAVYHAMMDVYLDMGYVREARRVYSDMQQCSIPADTVTYGLLIRLLAKSGDETGAMRIINLMEEKGFTPDRIHLTGVLEARVRSRKPCHIDLIERRLFHKLGMDPVVLVFCIKGARGVGDKWIAWQRGKQLEILSIEAWAALVNGVGTAVAKQRHFQLVIESKEEEEVVFKNNRMQRELDRVLDLISQEWRFLATNPQVLKLDTRSAYQTIATLAHAGLLPQVGEIFEWLRKQQEAKLEIPSWVKEIMAGALVEASEEVRSRISEEIPELFI